MVFASLLTAFMLSATCSWMVPYLLGLSSCVHLQVKPTENPCLVLAKVSPKIRYIKPCTFHSATTRKLESSSTHEIGDELLFYDLCVCLFSSSVGNEKNANQTVFRFSTKCMSSLEIRSK